MDINTAVGLSILFGILLLLVVSLALLHKRQKTFLNLLFIVLLGVIASIWISYSVTDAEEGDNYSMGSLKNSQISTSSTSAIL